MTHGNQITVVIMGRSHMVHQPGVFHNFLHARHKREPDQITHRF
jgi:hypothetical protein